MNTQMPKDFERLSAYIDNQLSPAEKADLEARLAKEPELQAGLNDLRRTVRVLRSLPTVKPPRNFTLTAEQVGARARRGPLFPAFRLAAALCTLLLGLAVARDYVTTSLGASGARDFTTQSSAVTAPALPNAAPLLTPTPGTGVESLGASAAGPTGTTSAAVAVTPFAHLAPVQLSPTPTREELQTSATPDATNKNVGPTETPQDTAISVAALPPNVTETSVPNVAPPAAEGLSGLRLVEIALAALALALAAGAWFTRRG
jgi:anti-sigma factor RsiW